MLKNEIWYYKLYTFKNERNYYKYYFLLTLFDDFKKYKFH